MKRLLLSTAALLCVAASIFASYYFYSGDDSNKIASQNSQSEQTEVEREMADPDAPMRLRGGAWKDENGNIKENGIADALAQRDLYLSNHMPTDGFGDKGDAASIPAPQVPTNWISRGPQNLGGHTRSILLYPTFGPVPVDRGIMWAGGSTGGVWKSYNGGNSWYATNNKLQNFTVSCLALDPQNPDVIYAGTGQAAEYVYGSGVFKSSDGGMTWTRLDRTYREKWKAVNGITVMHQTIDSIDRTVLLAAVENFNLYDNQAERGIMRSVDGGVTWTKMIDGEMASFVGLNPNDPSRAVAATCHTADPSHPNGYCKAWYSADYGATWSASQLDRCDGQGFVAFESPRYRDSIQFAFRTTGSETTIYAQYGDMLGIGTDDRTVMSKSTNGGAYFSTYNMMGVHEGISQGVQSCSEPRAICLRA